MTSNERPNILLITADDMNGDTPGCCGGPADVTPRIDQLAAEGVVFRRAHVPVAVCQPSRSAIMTGRWPHRNGAEGFEPVHDDVPLLTDVLRPAGYRVGILGKVHHLEPVERFGWDVAVQPSDLGVGRDPAAYAAAAWDFLAEASSRQQPWFLMANAHDPHRPFYGSDQERESPHAEAYHAAPAPSKVFGADEVKVPAFLPDLPEVRQEIAEYQSSSRRCDDVVGTLLDTLADSGQQDNTLVVFLSDNGMAFPFAKANCYLHSTRTPLIVRWPGRVDAGRVDDTHFVSGLDLFPTFCDAAALAGSSAELDQGLDGRSLTGLLAGRSEPNRDHVHTVFHETSGKQRFEMRCIQDGQVGYIWNAWSDGVTGYRAENMQGRSWPAMRAAARRGSQIEARADFYLHRAPEELYRLDVDPDCLTNLAGRADHRHMLQNMREHVAQWMSRVDDPLAERYAPGFSPLDGPSRSTSVNAG